MDEIIDEALAYVKNSAVPDCKAWSTGLMQDVEDCYKELHCPRTFNYWRAHSLAEARAIKEFFALELGMKAERRPDLHLRRPTYIYIRLPVPPRS